MLRCSGFVHKCYGLLMSLQQNLLNLIFYVDLDHLEAYQAELTKQKSFV